MPLSKLSLIYQLTTVASMPAFAAARTAGFSESWWFNGAAGLIPGILGRVGVSRAAVLPAQCTIVGARTETYTININKLIPGGTQSTAAQLPGNPNYPCDLPNIDLRVSILGSNGINVGRINIHAIPDQFSVTGEFAPSGAFAGQIGNFLGTLGNQGLGFVGRDLGQPTARVIAYTPPAGATPGQLEVDAPITGLAGTFFRFHRVYDNNGNPVKGVYMAGTPVGNVYPVPNGPTQTVTQPSGLIRKDVLAFFNYTATATIGSLTTRRVGKPLRGFRGRKSKSRV
jgi:hypothetical protein